MERRLLMPTSAIVSTIRGASGLLRRNLKWDAIAPVTLLAIVLAAVALLDMTTGGDAKPAPYAGDLGTPVRYAYIVPPTVVGSPTPISAPTKPAPVATSAQGNPADRDARRKLDLLQLVAAALKLKAQDGSYPTTNNQVQTLCKYENLDQGCKFKD